MHDGAHPSSRRAILSALLVVGLCGFVYGVGRAHAQTDPLPSWNDGAVKKAIIDFVPRVTTPGGPDFVPVDQRIA
jgi:hypothetical protein